MFIVYLEWKWKRKIVQCWYLFGLIPLYARVIDIDLPDSDRAWRKPA